MSTKKPTFKKANREGEAERFEAADQVMQAGGYADHAGGTAKAAASADPPAKPAGESTRQPTSWLASAADRELLHRLQGSLMMRGHKVSQSQVLVLGLEALKKMDGAERAALFQEIFG